MLHACLVYLLHAARLSSMHSPAEYQPIVHSLAVRHPATWSLSDGTFTSPDPELAVDMADSGFSGDVQGRCCLIVS